MFRVEDGAIAGGSLREPVRDSVYLATTREFADFELHVKFKAVPTKGDEAKLPCVVNQDAVPVTETCSGSWLNLPFSANRRLPPRQLSGREENRPREAEAEVIAAAARVEPVTVGYPAAGRTDVPTAAPSHPIRASFSPGWISSGES